MDQHSAYADDTLQELVGQSLRDIIEERNRTLNKKCMLHRIVYISIMDGSPLEEIAGYYEKLLKDIQNQNECITGLLLMYKKCCIHSSTENIAEFCVKLKEDKRYMTNTKILTVSHDIPSRLYQHWSYRLLDVSFAGNDEYGVSVVYSMHIFTETIFLGEDWSLQVTEILERMLKLGLFLSHQPKVQPKNAMDTLREKVPELLPDQGAIIHLVESDENCIEDLDLFEKRYSQPYDILLERDFTWPMCLNPFPIA